ncbi:MAG: septal ring lytic transglycosylase RlpA family protein [Bacteroidota bacterium]
MRYLLLFLISLSIAPFLSAQLVGDKENGLASYYGKQFEGATTAYGVVYNSNDMVAAHRIYPLNSVVRVENMENGKTVEVRIIDEGPFISGRIIQLSERAAANLGMIGRNTVQVELTLLSTPDQVGQAITAAEETINPVEEAQIIEESTAEQVPDPPAPTPAETQPSLPDPAPAPASAPENASAPATALETPTPTVSAAAAEVKATPVGQKEMITNGNFAPGVYKIQLLKPAEGKYGVQVGSFKDLEGAMAKVTELQGKWFKNILLERVSTGPASVYKIILGPFLSEESAQNYASDLKSRYKITGFTVTIK